MSAENPPPPPPEEENPEENKQNQLPAVAEPRNVIPYTGELKKEGPAELIRRSPLIYRPGWTEVPQEETQKRIRITEELIKETKERLSRNAEDERVREERRSRTETAEKNKGPESSKAEKGPDKNLENKEKTQGPESKERKSSGSERKETLKKNPSTKKTWKDMTPRERAVGVGKRLALPIAVGGGVVLAGEAGLWAANTLASSMGLTSPAALNLGIFSGLATLAFFGYIDYQLWKSIREDGMSVVNDMFGWLGIKGSTGGSRAPRRSSGGGGGGH